jgi:hypothetical protein
MILNKLKIAAILVLAAGVIGTGATALRYRLEATEPARANLQSASEPAQPREDERADLIRIPSLRDGRLAAIGPGDRSLVRAAEIATVLPAREASAVPLEFSASRDGKKILIRQGERVMTADNVLLTVTKDGKVHLTYGGMEATMESAAGMKHRRWKVGDTVEKGQLLARVDDKLARHEVAIKEAKVRQCKIEVVVAEKTRDEAQTRYESSVKLRTLSKLARPDEEVRGAKLVWERYVGEVDGKKAAVEIAEQELKQAQAVLETYEIRAPARGVLRAIYKQPGEAVRSLEAVFLLQVEAEKE